MENLPCTWPEQDAIDEWWSKYSYELKKSVSKYRIELQRATNSGGAQSDNVLKDEISALIPAVEACRGYARDGEAISESRNEPVAQAADSPDPANNNLDDLINEANKRGGQ
jgi:hypothetical protein